MCAKICGVTGGGGDDVSGADLVPLLDQPTRLQLGVGVSVRMSANVSFYADADYRLAVGDTDGGRRDGIRGAADVRRAW
jgi:outer membrane autotransporter protein